MTISTFNPINSSIHNWLTYDGTALPSLPTCQHDGKNTNCTHVCQNSSSLFSASSDQSSNLVTCGLWTKQIIANSMYGNGSLSPTNHDNWSSLISAFEPLGLGTYHYQDASTYADTISNCFEFIYLNVKQYSYADDGKIPAACTRSDLFPVNSSYTSLNDCLTEICSPLTLDPDLAGIGVSIEDREGQVRKYMLTSARYFRPSLYSPVLLSLSSLLSSALSYGVQPQGCPRATQESCIPPG